MCVSCVSYFLCSKGGFLYVFLGVWSHEWHDFHRFFIDFLYKLPMFSLGMTG